MATVTFSFKDLVGLIGKDVSLDKIREDLFELGSETEAIEGDEVTFEVTSDRADLLCEEGIARMLRAYYGIETGPQDPEGTQVRLQARRELGSRARAALRDGRHREERPFHRRVHQVADAPAGEAPRHLRPPAQEGRHRRARPQGHQRQDYPLPCRPGGQREVRPAAKRRGNDAGRCAGRSTRKAWTTAMCSKTRN